MSIIYSNTPTYGKGCNSQNTEKLLFKVIDELDCLEVLINFDGDSPDRIMIDFSIDQKMLTISYGYGGINALSNLKDLFHLISLKLVTSADKKIAHKYMEINHLPLQFRNLKTVLRILKFEFNNSTDTSETDNLTIEKNNWRKSPEFKAWAKTIRKSRIDHFLTCS
ncbi:hypothetical protein I5M27_02390 [Adhaeribacter sp. BT258]|uniref:Uncharacterized protein n=1 Tax=Adhaeribacter terrigena TaxID=2793070 RepID=A0ABS1BXK6_9BACT|nr:hypothetical protein [Adhaeribacter terrigena]MBK0401814.1 hypothetical protein [Adhaeribacter terrigena]